MTSFLAGYLDRGATRSRKQAYIATMCLGIFLFREGMHRELKIARAVERVVVEAQEGIQVKLVTVKGREHVSLLRDLRRAPGKSEEGIVKVVDPENVKAWFELDQRNAVVNEREIIEGALDGKIAEIDTREMMREMGVLKEI